MKGIKMEQKQTLAKQAAQRDAGKKSISGDFVRADQEMAAREGFSAVSKSWFEKTLGVEGVVDSLVDQSSECLDLEVHPDDLRLEENGKIVLDGEPLSFTHNAAGNLCDWAKIPQGCRDAFLAPGDDEGTRLFSEAVNRGLRIHQADRDNLVKLRLRGTSVRAVVSHQYQSIENAWTMETLSKIVPGGRVSHFRHDGDTMSGLLLIPDTIRSEEDSDYGGGIHFRNSEIGKARMVLRPSVFRSICMNGCIWGELAGDSFVSAIHRGEIDFEQLAQDMYRVVNEQIPLTTKCIDDMLATKEIRLEAGIDCIRVMANQKGLTASQKKAWVYGWIEEGHDPSAFGIVQGLTRAARDTANPKHAVDMEVQAASLVSRDRMWWDFQTEFAGKEMDDEELMKILTEPLVNEALQLV